MTEITLTKPCSTCKIDLPVEHFHSNKSKKDGLANCCKSCQKEHSKRHYEANKQEYMDRNTEVRRKQRAEILERKKNEPCADCGKTFHPYIMEFDHRDPSTKKFSIARIGRISNATLERELAKCDLVCANCHKLRTFERKRIGDFGLEN